MVRRARARPGGRRARRRAAPGEPAARRHDARAPRVPEPAERDDGPLPSNNLGASHVAFQVDDIQARKAELEAQGIEFFSDVNVVDEGVLAGWRWVYFADPDGYPLELVEVAYYNADERREGIAEYLAARGEASSRT